MSSKITPKELDRVHKAFKQRMMLYALGDRKQVDVRIATRLQMNDLLTSAKPTKVPKNMVAVLADPKHAKRVPVPPGPLIFQLKTGKRPEALVVDVADFLLNPDLQVRKAALAHFEHLASKDDLLLTQRSSDTIKSNREALISRDKMRWRPAALAISDTIKNDWLCSLAGVRQCLARRFDEGIGPHLRIVLRPEVASIDSINFQVWSPSLQQSVMDQIIKGCVEDSASLKNALVKYYRELGHLPLHRSYAMSQVVEEWLRHQQGKAAEVWKTVWSWADEIQSPLPRYHACEVFICNPHLVPNGSNAKLWDEIAEILPQTEEKDLKWAQAWQIRCELARHFCNHLGSRLPLAERERIANCSWWMAEQLSLVFGTASGNIQHVRESTISREEELSNLTWQLSHPAARPASLHYATTHLPSVWSLSLLSLMDGNLEALKPEDISSQNRVRIGKAVSGSLVFGFPLHQAEEKDAVYGYDATPLGMAEAWSTTEPDEERKTFIRVLVDAFQLLREPVKLKEAIRDVYKQNDASRLLLAGVMRGLAYTGKAPERDIWFCIEDAECRRKLLLGGHERTLEVLVDALIEIQCQYWNRWASDLPHYFATACEETTGDAARHDILFACTVLSSASTDTVSAVQHLLRGKHRQEFRSQVAYWQEQFNGLHGALPPWIEAKLRAIRAALHFV